MQLRIRCPDCRTILRIAPGVRPVCPKCGFGGPAGTKARGPDSPGWGNPDWQNVIWDDGSGAPSFAATEPKVVWNEASAQ